MPARLPKRQRGDIRIKGKQREQIDLQSLAHIVLAMAHQLAANERPPANDVPGEPDFAA